jgi:hypothetical protein
VRVTMPSWITVPSRTVRSEIAGAAAILICFAVVLGAVDLSQSTARDTTRTYTEPAVEHAVVRAVAVPQSAAFDQTGGPFVMPAAVDGEPVRLETAAAAAEPTRLETAAAPAPAADPHSEASASHDAASAAMLGVWAPDGSTCALRDFRQGLLPTIINADGAWAGNTFCTFTNRKQTDTGWRVVAHCSNAEQQWTTKVDFTIKGDRLIWASKRGTQIYTRCPSDFLMETREAAR